MYLRWDDVLSRFHFYTSWLRFIYCKGPEVRAAPRVLEHFGRVQEDVKAVEVLCRNSFRYNRPKTIPDEECTCLKMLKPPKPCTNKLWPFFDACRTISKYNIVDFDLVLRYPVDSVDDFNPGNPAWIPQAEALRRCEETAEAQSEAKMEMDNMFGRLDGHLSHLYSPRLV